MTDEDGRSFDDAAAGASGTIAAAALSIAVLAAGSLAGSDSVLTLVSLPLLVFLPGYALLAYLGSSRSAEPTSTGRAGSVPFAARTGFLATAVGVSLLIVTTVAVALVPLGGSLFALVAGVAGVTVALCGATILNGDGSIARSDLAPHAGRAADAGRGSLAIAALTGLLVVGVGLAAVGPAAPDAEGFTEFYLLERTSEGPTVAHDATIDPDSPAEFLVGVENHERERTNYTVVAQFQITRLDRTERLVTTPEGPVAAGNRSATPAADENLVANRREIGRFHADLDHNGTRQISHTFVPPAADNRSRVVYLLYRGDPPADPSRENAYRSLVVWDERTDPSGVTLTEEGP